MPGPDRTLAYLLDLDGEEIVYDGGYTARFKVTEIEATHEKPHGISYSLTFHAASGHRLMGFDNAHNVAHRGGKFVERHTPFDHWHRNQTDEGRPYLFVNAEKLISDFFTEIGRILKEQNDG
jgi:hypothetical protein